MLTGYALRFLARLINIIAPAQSPGKAPRGNGVAMPTVECFVAESESPLRRDGNWDRLTKDAMTLTDEDTYGYVVVVLKKPNGAGHSGQIEVSGYVQDEWEPAFQEVFHRAALGVSAAPH